ncbi:hypothetical protein [Candidatus Ichthyocystis hellenicum]|uniref:hypothetical protein n=1 Tax=Candidatus Ichthyocystis hellenicum TaxID=1561003 RepID=UPI000B84343E|nr:hypothetical protein [Candidatus Ichthyocystis hellenicum]
MKSIIATVKEKCAPATPEVNVYLPPLNTSSHRGKSYELPLKRKTQTATEEENCVSYETDQATSAIETDCRWGTTQQKIGLLIKDLLNSWSR